MVFRNLDWEKRGIKINGKWLNNLRFADDIVLISGNIQELRLMSEELCKESEKVGLTINLTKTKLITKKEEGEFIINNMVIEKVSEYKYLGQLVSFQVRTEKRIECKNRWSMEKLVVEQNHTKK